MAKARRIKNIKCEAAVIENAQRIIMVRLEELLSWTPYIDDPVNIPEIHHMRIAAKRLRYTLELFRPILDSGTKGLIEEIKAIQEDIGTMRDADVMIERVVTMISDDGAERMSRMLDIATASERGTVPQRRQRMRSAAVARQTVRDEVGLYTLVAHHADQSAEAYQEFLRAWYEMMATDFVGRLRQHIGVDPKPVPKVPKAKREPKSKGEAATEVENPVAVAADVVPEPMVADGADATPVVEPIDEAADVDVDDNMNTEDRMDSDADDSDDDGDDTMGEDDDSDDEDDDDDIDGSTDDAPEDAA